MTIQHANDKVAVYETRCAFWELSVARSASKIIILHYRWREKLL